MNIGYLLSLLIILPLQAKDCYLWGTYKPHLLYHYQEKDGSSFGLMYQKSGLNIPLRFKYSNSDSYSTYLLQDFKGTIHSLIKDQKSDLELDIKTLYDCEDYWQTQIQLRQGFQLPQSSHFAGYSTELVLYFYNRLPGESIRINNTQTGMIVTFPKSNQTFHIKLMYHYDQKDILAYQTLNYPYSTLWKTDQIYQRYTYKKVDIRTGVQLNTQIGFEVLSEEKKIKANSKSFKESTREKYLEQLFYGQNNDGTTLINSFIYEYLKICPFDQKNYVYYLVKTTAKNKSKYTAESEDNEFTENELNDNIGFIQLTTRNYKQTVIIEHFGPNQTNSIKNFQEEFEKKKQSFENAVQTKYLPKDFAFFNQKQYQTKYSYSSKVLQPQIKELKNTTEAFLKCLQQTISNILGGIVYYRGKLNRSDKKEDQEKTVFSASPSRTLFSRGFLWDDGFQLIPICQWDRQLCKKILLNWMDLMDEDGWIAREQARGEEIKSHMPFKFVSQDPQEANPPTLLLPFRLIMVEVSRTIKKIRGLMEKLDDSYTEVGTDQKIREETEIKELIKLYQMFVVQETDFIKLIYPKLKLWQSWFIKTQSHQDEELINLRWRCKGGCDSGLFLGSGMDDYPRLKQEANHQEHLDLKCWMMLFENTFSQIEVILADISFTDTERDKHFLSAENYFDSYDQMIRDMYKNFQDPEDSLFKDYAKRRSYLYGPQTIFNFELGYVNLFPMFFGSLNSSTFEWKAIIRHITDRNQMWSVYGVRSLSKRSIYYGTGEDYWRGAIWMPINYLLLRGIRLYSSDDASQKLYYTLRENLILNIYNNWEESGFMFENYNGDTGKGQRAFPFDGWTGATFLALCSETYE